MQIQEQVFSSFEHPVDASKKGKLHENARPS